MASSGFNHTFWAMGGGPHSTTHVGGLQSSLFLWRDGTEILDFRGRLWLGVSSWAARVMHVNSPGSSASGVLVCERHFAGDSEVFTLASRGCDFDATLQLRRIAGGPETPAERVRHWSPLDEGAATTRYELLFPTPSRYIPIRIAWDRDWSPGSKVVVR